MDDMTCEVHLFKKTAGPNFKSAERFENISMKFTF